MLDLKSSTRIKLLQLLRSKLAWLLENNIYITPLYTAHDKLKSIHINYSKISSIIVIQEKLWKGSLGWGGHNLLSAGSFSDLVVTASLFL